VQVDPKLYPSGERFLVKEYPKDKKCRRPKLAQLGHYSDCTARWLPGEAEAEPGVHLGLAGWLCVVGGRDQIGGYLHE
jgi:hypothetical protein